MRDSVRQAGRSARYAGPVEPDEVPRPQPVLEPRNLVRDPVARVERQALEVMLQLPGMAAAALADQIPSRTFRTPIHQSVFDAISAAGGVSAYVVKFDQLSAAGMPQTDASNRASTWFVEQVENQADDLVKNAVRQFAVEPLPENDEKEPWPYVRGIILSLIRQGIVHQIADLRREMRMIDADSPRQNELFEMLMKLEATRRAYDEAD